MANDFNEGKYNIGDDDMDREDMSFDYLRKRKERTEKESEAIKKAIKDQSYMRMVDRFQKAFDGLIMELLKVLTQSKRYETHIANLATRLDYNGFYTIKLLAEENQIIELK